MFPRVFALSFAILAVLTSPPAIAQHAPTVAAASDLKFALEEIAAQFKAESGKEVRMTFGSSGNFKTQLMQGAPFEIFLSADEGFIFQLAEAGKTVDRGALYAEGRIVLFAPKGSGLKPDASFKDLRTALTDASSSPSKLNTRGCPNRFCHVCPSGEWPPNATSK